MNDIILEKLFDEVERIKNEIKNAEGTRSLLRLKEEFKMVAQEIDIRLRLESRT